MIDLLHNLYVDIVENYAEILDKYKTKYILEVDKILVSLEKADFDSRNFIDIIKNYEGMNLNLQDKYINQSDYRKLFMDYIFDDKYEDMRHSSIYNFLMEIDKALKNDCYVSFDNHNKKVTYSKHRLIMESITTRENDTIYMPPEYFLEIIKEFIISNLASFPFGIIILNLNSSSETNYIIEDLVNITNKAYEPAINEILSNKNLYLFLNNYNNMGDILFLLNRFDFLKTKIKINLIHDDIMTKRFVNATDIEKDKMFNELFKDVKFIKKYSDDCDKFYLFNFKKEINNYIVMKKFNIDPYVLATYLSGYKLSDIVMKKDQVPQLLTGVYLSIEDVTDFFIDKYNKLNKNDFFNNTLSKREDYQKSIKIYIEELIAVEEIKSGRVNIENYFKLNLKDSDVLEVEILKKIAGIFNYEKNSYDWSSMYLNLYEKENDVVNIIEKEESLIFRFKLSKNVDLKKIEKDKVINLFYDFFKNISINIFQELGSNNGYTEYAYVAMLKKEKMDGIERIRRDIELSLKLDSIMTNRIKKKL